MFRDDEDRLLALGLIGELDARFGIEVHAFCLMGNHLHLLVRSRDGALSSAMQWLMSTFTKAVNVRRGVDGAIFRGRFHSVLVERESHLDWLFRYINANPRDLGWSRPLIDYPWSGLSGAVDGVRFPWLHTDYVHERFGPDPSTFLRFVDPAADGSESRDADLTCDIESIVLAAQLACAPGPDVHSRADVRRIVEIVGRDIAGTELSDLYPQDANERSRRRRLAAARALVEQRRDLADFRDRVLEILQTDRVLGSGRGERRLTPIADTDRNTDHPDPIDVDSGVNDV